MMIVAHACGFDRWLIATGLLIAPPTLAQTLPDEARPHLELVSQYLGAGAMAVDLNADEPEGTADVDFYHYFFAQGRGERQSGRDEQVQVQPVASPLGLGETLSLSAASSMGGDEARAEVRAHLRKTDRTLHMIGYLASSGSGMGAGGTAVMMLGVVVHDRSTIRIENCALFKPIGLPPIPAENLPAASCLFKASGDPADGMNAQDLPLTAHMREGQFLMFEIEEEWGGPMHPPGAARGAFAIEIRPGAGTCIAVLEGPGTSSLEGWALTDLLGAYPQLEVHTRTERDLAALQGEIDLGMGPYAGPEARELAERAAARLAEPLDADVRLEFRGAGGAEGTHSVVLSPRSDSPRTLEFTFSDTTQFDDVEAFIQEVIAAMAPYVNDC